jgi:maleate cis-trans isomerase
VAEGGDRQPTVGWVKPGALDLSKMQTLSRMVPPGLNLSVLTTLWSLQMMNAEHFDAVAFDQQRGTILQTVHDFMEYSTLDYVAVTGDLIQAAMGVEWDLQVRDALAEATGLPVNTGMTALVGALHYLGAGKVLIGSPYTDRQNGYYQAYLEAVGFDVVATHSRRTSSSKEVRQLPKSAPYDTAKELLTAHPEADVLYLASPSWASNEVVDQIEREFDRPVITMMGGMLWAAEDALGWTRPVQGFGRLLASVGGH